MESDLILPSMSANIAERGKAGPEREAFAVPSEFRGNRIPGALRHSQNSSEIVWVEGPVPG